MERTDRNRWEGLKGVMGLAWQAFEVSKSEIRKREKRTSSKEEPRRRHSSRLASRGKQTAARSNVGKEQLVGRAKRVW